MMGSRSPSPLDSSSKFGCVVVAAAASGAASSPNSSSKSSSSSNQCRPRPKGDLLPVFTKNTPLVLFKQNINLSRIFSLPNNNYQNLHLK